MANSTNNLNLTGLTVKVEPLLDAVESSLSKQRNTKAILLS